MNADRLWVIAGVGGMLVVAILGWMLGVSPVVAQAASANSQAASLSSVNASSVAKLALLKKQYADIATFRKELRALRQSIPTEASISVFLREIDVLCTDYGVTLTAVTVDNATVYQAPAPVAPTTATTDTSTPTPTPTAPATGGTPAATSAPANTPSSSLLLIPITVNVSGPFAKVMAFAKGVQTGARLYLVSQLSVNPAASATGGETGQFQAAITGNVYSLAGISDSTNDAAGTKAPSPSPSTTPAPTDTATAKPTDTSTSLPTP